MPDVSRDLERWLPVAGHEGAYEVSDLGRVRSIGRWIGPPGRRYLPGRVMRQGPRRDGTHHAVCLYRGKGRRSWFVHRLVLIAFVGPPTPGQVCCHNDGDPHNNRLSNLRWGTHSENNQDCVAHGNNHYKQRTACPRGHKLAAPNLCNLTGGHRKCLACSRAQARKQYAVRLGRTFDFKKTSDAYYRAIMADAA